MNKILYLTDLNYVAKGRNYYEEDIYLTGRLREHFDVALCHPACSESFEREADMIVFRNTGGVSGFKDIYHSFVERAKANNLKVFNELTGKADMRGKQYLLDLTTKNYPVIPAIERKKDLHLLPETDRYVIKPKNGADSIGLEFLTRKELVERNLTDGIMLIQPQVDFEYEVSFYFLNDKLEYALYAPDKSHRWDLKRYHCTDEDIAFAESFISWNDIKTGIQRVDACRTRDGRLLLIELEDLNPYLSLLELDEKTRETFVADMVNALKKYLL